MQRRTSSDSTTAVRLAYAASFSNDDVPDEASLRRAYDSWRDFYAKQTVGVQRRISPEFDQVRYQNFKDNFIALKKANYKSALKAKAAGQVPPPPMQLNEYGDCSADEYMQLSNNNNGNSGGASNSKPPIPTTVNSKTLTPPPTATPWTPNTVSSSSSSSSATSNHQNDSSRNNNNSNSDRRQVDADGTYSYVPPRNNQASKDNTRPSSKGSYGASYLEGSNSFGGGGGGIYGGGPPPNGSYMPGSMSGAGAYDNTNSMSSKYMPGPPPRQPYGDDPYAYAGGREPYQSRSSSSSTFNNSNNNSNNNYSNYGYNPNASGGYNPGGTPPYNSYNSYSAGAPGGGATGPIPPPSNAQDGPPLSQDEQAALERARNRHNMIPKGVFDEDESEDENTDNSWANFGMPKQKKIRREKMDLPPPVVNGVGNGGMIGIGPNGPNMGNMPSTSFGRSQPNRVGNSYSDIRKVSGGGGGGGRPPNSSNANGINGASPATGGGDPNTNMYTQDRIRDAYQDWCNNHNKVFEEARLPTFQKNYLEMERYSQETGTPLRQLNQYADLSPDEFKAVRTPPSRKSDKPDWMEESIEDKIESKDEFLNFGPRWGKDPPRGAEALLNKDAIDPVTGAKRDFQGERRLRLAYQEWCNKNGKRFDETRLPIFTSNLVAMEQYCLMQNIPVKPLNEYADLSPTEYQAVLQERERVGDPMPSFSNAESSMPPPMNGNNYAGSGGGGGGMPPPPMNGNNDYPMNRNGMPPPMPPGMGVMAPPGSFGGPPPGMGGYGGYGGGVGPLGQPPAQFSYGGQGYGSAMAPGGTNTPPPTQGMPSSSNLDGQGGTIPPVNIANGASASYQSQSQPAPPRKPTEAEFKASAQARLQAFTESKKLKSSTDGGDLAEERVKRFAKLKQQVSELAVKQNVTLEDATKEVFGNATALLERENKSLLLRATSANTTTAIQKTRALAATNTTKSKSASREDSSGNARAVVDLSAVLSIEKDTIKTEPKKKGATNTTSEASSPAEEKPSPSRSHVQKKPLVNVTNKNAAVSEPVDDQLKRAEAAKQRYASKKASKGTLTDSPAKTVVHKSTKKAGHSSSSSTPSKAPPKDDTTIEESSLKAEMKAIQEKLKTFEEARKKAEAEAKQKAAEAARLKQAIADKKKSKQAADDKQSKKVSDPYILLPSIHDLENYVLHYLFHFYLGCIPSNNNTDALVKI